MSWKDLFAFSRSERNGIIVFIIILIIIIASPLLHKTFFFTDNTIDPESFKREIAAFEEHLGVYPKKNDNNRLAAVNYDIDEKIIEAKKAELKPFKFNPNELPEETWLKMGLPERVVRTIKNFEAAGGSFRYKEDLKRIYNLTEEVFYTLEPYIELPSREHEVFDTVITDKIEIIEEETPLLIDINTADSLELVKIRGIGPVFSSRIVRYRELLGGYRSVDQLLEVYGMDEEKFHSINEYIIVQDSTVNKININNAEFGDLVRHPYIDRNIANNVIQLRKQHGMFKTIEDIKRSRLIDSELYVLIEPYIKVD